MNETFNLINITRQNFTSLIDSLSLEQINTVPPGFNNNIIWNFGHIVVSASGLVYGLSGLPPVVDERYIFKYKKGTKPEADVPEEEVNDLKNLAFSTIAQLQKDHDAGIFKKYKSYTTSFNNTLNNVADAIRMVQSHDALHYGYAMALKRNLK